MKKKISVAITTFLLSTTALASSFGELKTQIEASRESLLVLLKDQTKRDKTQQALVKSTADTVSKTIPTIKVDASKKAQFDELVKVWTDFKKTREEELVPAILSGKQAEAEKIATGVQKERMGKMMDLLKKLMGGDEI